MKSKITLKVVGTVCLLCMNLSAWAQVLTTQYSFTNTPDGAGPLRLAQANGLLFGSTTGGGTNGVGTLFLFNTNSRAHTTIYNFTAAVGSGSSPNNLIVSGNKIYGTTYVGGTNNVGMVYAVGTNGSGFTSLYSFGGYPDGEYPRAGLVLSNGVLYGTTYSGGAGISASAGGTIFKINTNGTGYATMHSFTNTPDGAQPQGELIVGGANLYGATTFGGISNKGTIFSINTNGGSYTILHSFTNTPDPIYPYGGMVLSGGVLYGTGSSGGTNGNGAIFAINTNGSGLRVLYSFSGFAGNLDGTTPNATLTLSVSGNYLLGTTINGGAGGGGTIFLINTNGSGFSIIRSFTNGAADGSDLLGGVIRAGNAVWGTTYGSGINNGGTLFQLPMPAILSQPQSITVTNATPAAFSVTAADDQPVQYQWYFNTNTVLAAQTNNTLTLASATNKNAGTYTVVVSDSSGSVTSLPAVLTVVGMPVITKQPQSVVVTNGNSATFTAAATGLSTLAYQWFFHTNTLVLGATNTFLVFTNAITNLAGYYSVRVTNSVGSVTSSYALLTVSNQLNFLSFTFDQTGGSPSFVLANIAKSTNKLWTSTNLAQANVWKVIATNVMATNGLWFFTDTNAAKTNAMRFYRFSSQ